MMGVKLRAVDLLGLQAPRYIPCATPGYLYSRAILVLGSVASSAMRQGCGVLHNSLPESPAWDR